MTDSKLSMLFFEGGLVLALVSMVLGPFGVENWAVSSAAVACFMALAGIYIAFGSWNEEGAPPKKLFPKGTETPPEISEEPE